MIWQPSEAEQQADIRNKWSTFPVGRANPIHLRGIRAKDVPVNPPIKNTTFNAAAYPIPREELESFLEILKEARDAA